ncbi:TonB-linked SusC/RagA family outer membrane protein [Pedobacter sp. AK013]|uniref:SusC/RagA family TonB-linked outer membrane protein n=1 Tax=Pedobacter sp. AK013 TaxID=2723071 RepID=UPI0016092F8B|nr:TonB-dependent receptor [Pedobacter sp. AK013]MBB6235568.1 TonB-linked SusC/RagA family outer membrane protein [Pedobacter sp. AK013]
MEKSIHRKKLAVRLVLFLAIAMLTKNASAQQENTPIINSTLIGSVKDSITKQPIGNVVLSIKGTTHAVTSAPDGSFSFRTGQKFPYTLIVSFIGYQTKQIVVDGSPITILLVEKTSSLNDVVVMGYGSQKKSDVTGSVASVSKNLLAQPAASFDNMLQGGVSGIGVTQNSGQPGGTATVRIRGGNSISFGNAPLYVIDGFIVYNNNDNVNVGSIGTSSNALSTINPSDIESVEVLKDASATAIYGSRGANGVIIITTKKGKKGVNNVNYNGYYGTQRVARKLNLLNGSQWAALINDINTSDGVPKTYTDAQIAAFGTGSDWQGSALSSAPILNQELSVSGGDEKSRYLISGNYFKQDGIIINSGYERYSARINYEKDISEKFKVTTNFFGSRSIENKLAGSAYNSINFSNAYANLILTAPIAQIKNTDGSYNTSNPLNATPTNPLQDIAATTNQNTLNRILGNAAAEYKISKELTLKVTAGVDILNTNQQYYAPSFTASPAGASTGYATKGYATLGSGNALSWLNENTLTYNHTFAEKHFLNALVGYSTQYENGKSFTTSAQQFPNDLTTFDNLSYAGIANLPSSAAHSSSLNSVLARINYSYLHRYNITLSERADGSSKLGKENKWGFFSSVGVSWNVNDEEFFKSLQNVVNSFKIRLSAGQTGNSEIPPYSSLSSLSPSNYYLGGKLVTGISPIQIANPDLKWETTTQYNAGLDLGFLNNRISVTFDVYSKKTTDLLLNVPLPLYTGYASALKNIGSVSNRGIEFSVNTENIKTPGFNWKSTLIFSANRNKVLSLGENVKSFFPVAPTGQVSPVIVQVGLPVGTFWGYNTNGLLTSADLSNGTPLLGGVPQQVGDTKYVDTNQDGIITTTDKHSLGSAQPKFTGSLSNTFNYKGLDLSIFFQGSYGNKVFNLLQQSLERPTLTQNASATLLDRWTPQNQGAVVPRVTNSPVPQVTDRLIEDASYLKLKNVSLGYTFKTEWANKIKLKNLRFYISAQNLFTITKYTGLDPEVNFYDNDNTKQGIDFGTYPATRTFLAGLSITL